MVNYTRQDFIVYGVMFVVAAGLFGMLAYSTLYAFPWQSHWLVAKGMVTEILPGAKQQTVYYSYLVDGRRIDSKERFHWHAMLLHAGDPLVVRYNPELPERSVIQTGLTIATFVWMLCSLFALAGAVSMFRSPPGEGVAIKWSWV